MQNRHNIEVVSKFAIPKGLWLFWASSRNSSYRITEHAVFPFRASSCARLPKLCSDLQDSLTCSGVIGDLGVCRR
jgi:hypothetical protein